MAEKKHGCEAGHRDLLQVTGATEDGGYTYVRRRADHEVEVGTLQFPEEGKSMQNPMILSPVNKKGLFEVEEVGGASDTKGPAKVTTDDYRVGWDRIFGGTGTVGQA
jgi:hypothetical protein